MEVNAKNILIIRLAALGDVLMSTPALRALRKGLPGAKITLLVGSSVSDALEGNANVDKVIEIDDGTFFKGSFSTRLKLIVRLVKMLRIERYDAAIILHRDWKYGLITLLCGIPMRIGLKRSLISDILLTDTVAAKDGVHHISHYIDAVKVCGALSDGLQMDFHIRKEVTDGVLRKFSVPGSVDQGRLIAVAPGGANNVNEVMVSRRWPAERYRSLIERLSSNGYRVVLIGSKTDIWFTEGWNVPPGVINLISRTSLEEAAAVLRLSALAVTNDSGPMHLASAAGTPVISIFGPTDPVEKRPLNVGSHYFWNAGGLKCAPCYSHGRFPDCKGVECMKGVSVDEVYEKVVELALKNAARGTLGEGCISP